jgi:hypothetical protein
MAYLENLPVPPTRAVSATLVAEASTDADQDAALPVAAAVP